MELIKKIEYEIKTKVKGVGDILGRITILDNSNFTENAIKYPIGLTHLGVVIDNLVLDYNAIPGLSDYKGKLTGNFILPNKVPVEPGGWKFRKSKQYGACVKEIYKILEEIIKAEAEQTKEEEKNETKIFKESSD